MQRKDVSHEDDVRKKELKKEKKRGEIVELFWKGRRKPQRRTLKNSVRREDYCSGEEENQ